MERYIVAMDTGGSKTRLCVFDVNGSLKSNLRCRGVGVAGEGDLSALLDELQRMDTIPFPYVERVVINVGGTNVQQIQEALSPLFPNARTHAFRESSGVLMGAICRMEEADVLLMAGTGSIALSVGEKGSMITDGWSPNTGDKGSGYWIGLETISRSLIALEQDSLSPLVKAVTGRETPFAPVTDSFSQMRWRDEVRAHLSMPLDRAGIAAYAKLAAAYAREGDEMARAIFSEAGGLLAETVLRGIRRAGCASPPRVLVSGGLVHCMDLWGTAFEEMLRSQIRCTVKVGDADMIRGALYYAMQTQEK